VTNKKKLEQACDLSVFLALHQRTQ